MIPLRAVRHALIVAPHADDETIGAWALMRRLAAQGTCIHVVIVSDGAASHPNSRRWPPARLVRERRRETRRAMAGLAIPPHRIHFLALPDGRLESGETTRAIARLLRRCPPPGLIVGPVAQDAHGDHRAVAHALSARPRGRARRLGYQVWPERRRPRHRGHAIPLTAQEMQQKRRVLRGYRTQAGLITDAEAGFSMTWRHLRAFVRPSERFTVLP